MVRVRRGQHARLSLAAARLHLCHKRTIPQPLTLSLVTLTLTLTVTVTLALTLALTLTLTLTVTLPAVAPRSIDGPDEALLQAALRIARSRGDAAAEEKIRAKLGEIQSQA